MQCRESDSLGRTEFELGLTWSPDQQSAVGWGAFLRAALKRIMAWRVPPRWTTRDWHEEIHAEIVLAALQAHSNFDASRGIPWEFYLRKRVLQAALARYRREWAYSVRFAAGPGEPVHLRDRGGSSEAAWKSLLLALRLLPKHDHVLIESLFWGSSTESQVARRLGITQQAVNKRKRLILRKLQQALDSMELDAEVNS